MKASVNQRHGNACSSLAGHKKVHYTVVVIQHTWFFFVLHVPTVQPLEALWLACSICGLHLCRFAYSFPWKLWEDKSFLAAKWRFLEKLLSWKSWEKRPVLSIVQPIVELVCEYFTSVLDIFFANLLFDWIVNEIKDGTPSCIKEAPSIRWI